MTDTIKPSGRKFQFAGGELCLDFANTVGGMRDVSAREYLNSYADFVSWCRQAKILNDVQAVALLRETSRRPQDSTRALQRAIQLREAIYRIFAALADGDPPQPSHLGQLNGELSAALGRLRV